jgi:hypothetical protein
MSALKLTGNRCQCTVCDGYFNSTSTFDRHRVGRYTTDACRQCLTTAALIARGWSKNRHGFWIERAMRIETTAARVQTHRAACPATTLQAGP